MLVLNRKQNQQIFIGDNIVITIVEIKGITVRVGIQAPKDVVILRDDSSLRVEKRAFNGN